MAVNRQKKNKEESRVEGKMEKRTNDKRDIEERKK